MEELNSEGILGDEKVKKRKGWSVIVLFGVFVGVVFFGMIFLIEERKDPLLKSDVFVFHDINILHWFEFTSREGKLSGKLFQQEIIQKQEELPFMEEKEYAVIVETTEKGYLLKAQNGKESKVFDAWISGENLKVQKQRTKEYKVYESMNKKERDDHVKALQHDLEIGLDQTEWLEKKRFAQFVSEVESIYGYLSTADNGSTQLFLTIDEALLQGEVTASLSVITKSKSDKDQYEERKYILYGITDGFMVEFYTTLDGKETKLKGEFYGNASGFDLSFWTTNEKLSFHAVSKEMFRQQYNTYKSKTSGTKEAQ